MLTRMEQMEQEVSDKGIDLFFDPLPFGVNALYIRGKLRPIIAINTHLTAPYRLCACAEELGHHCTSSGNLAYASCCDYSRQERKARKWAAQHLLPLDILGNAYTKCSGDPFAMAEYLDLPKEYLDETICLYTDMYGERHSTPKYYVQFLPYFECKRRE